MLDHLAIDEAHSRLFIAELGNGTVGVVDLAQAKATSQIGGLSEPQGLAFVEATNTLYVASGGDGSVRIYAGDRLTPEAQIALGDDADNLRLDPKSGQVLAGYGSGALAVIDPATHKAVARIPLPAHPESFQLDPTGPLVYVNLPGAHQIVPIGRRANFQELLDISACDEAVAFGGLHHHPERVQSRGCRQLG